MEACPTTLHARFDTADAANPPSVLVVLACTAVGRPSRSSTSTAEASPLLDEARRWSVRSEQLTERRVHHDNWLAVDKHISSSIHLAYLRRSGLLNGNDFPAFVHQEFKPKSTEFWLWRAVLVCINPSVHAQLRSRHVVTEFFFVKA